MEYTFEFLSGKNLTIFQKMLFSSRITIFNKNSLNIDYFKQYLSCMNVNYNTSFIFNYQEENAGIFLSASNHKEAYILSIVVKDIFRGQGFGRIILEKGLSLLRDHGLNKVSLDVFQENDKAIKLYQSEGFHISNEIINYRNETKSFFTNNHSNHYELHREENFYLFRPIYLMFRKEKKIWQKSYQVILNKLKQNMAELYFIKTQESIVGFFILSRKENILEVVDFAIQTESLSFFPLYLSKLLRNENIVCALGIIQKDNLCTAFKESDFFIDSKQFEMRKVLK